MYRWSSSSTRRTSAHSERDDGGPGERSFISLCLSFFFPVQVVVLVDEFPRERLEESSLKDNFSDPYKLNP